MTITKPQAIFFDWDGTLADSYSFLDRAHSHVRQRFGFRAFEPGEYKQYFGQPREVLYPLIYGEENYEQAKIWFEDYVVENRHLLQPLEGADALMHAIADADIPMGVVSNKRGDFLRGEAAHFGWADIFVSVIGAGEALQDKPAADPLFKALNDGGLPDLHPDAVWFVGDTRYDLECARNAGAQAVLIRNGMEVEGLIKEYAPDLVAEDCRDFQEKLLHCL